MFEPAPEELAVFLATAAVPAAAAPPMLYVLVFFALLVVAGIAFGLMARKSFLRAELEAAEREKLLAPARRRAAQQQARSERRARLWLALGADAPYAPSHQELADALRALRRLEEMLVEAETWERRATGGNGLEISERAQSLYDVALGQVERGMNLADLASTLSGAAAARIRERKAQLIADLDCTIETLATSLDQLHASAIAGGFQDEGRKRLRDDLDSRLRIAAEVERRMLTLEHP